MGLFEGIVSMFDGNRGDFGTTSLPQEMWNAENYTNAQLPVFYRNILKEAMNDRDYNAMREDTYYQRMMNSMQQAGINPLVAFSNGGAPSMPLQQNSQLSGSYQKSAQLTELYERVREDTRDWGIDYMEKMSKIFKNFTGGVGAIFN